MTRYYKNIILFAFNSNPSRRGSSMIHPRRSLPSPNASPTQPVFRFSPNPHQHATREPSEKAGIMRVDIDFSRHFHFSTALAERAERNVKVLPFEIFCLHAILSWILRNSVKGGKVDFGWRKSSSSSITSERHFYIRSPYQRLCRNPVLIESPFESLKQLNFS